MKIFVTGGSGFIGSHTVVELLNAGHEIIIFDNLSNSSSKVIERIEKITGKTAKFYNEDILDKNAINRIFDKEGAIDCVIHFAGLKSVGESVKDPLRYYNNNIVGTLNLLEVMKNHGIKNLIFSSSATVYGTPKTMPITENFPLGECTNPYGKTKSMIENILTDIYNSDNSWNMILLRYFNALGAHPSGLIGENPRGVPNNLMPYITQVAIGKLDELSIFGNDYNTPDGTGVRDYIHVMDLADAHVKALKKIRDNSGLCIYNLGTGKGYSVREIIENFEKVTGIKIPYHYESRREGDIDSCYSSVDKAFAELGWSAKHSLEDMCRDSWNFQKKNPNGYDD